MDISDHIDSHAVLHVEVDQALLLLEVRVRAEDDLPDVALRQRLAILEPLDHGAHELEGDRVLPIFILRELGSSIALVKVAAACP